MLVILIHLITKKLPLATKKKIDFFRGSKPSKQVIKTLTTVVSRVKMAHENRRWKHRKKIPTLEESILSLSRVMTLDNKVWDCFTHITCIEGHNPRNKYFYLKIKNKKFFIAK